MYSYDQAMALPAGTSEAHTPSKKALSSAATEERKLRDKGKELHPSKVRFTVCCTSADCGKPRCIYAKHKPSEAQFRKLSAYLETVNYSCGDALFPEGLEGSDKKLEEIFYNSEALTCRNEMELNYYNYGGLRGREEFEHVCARCGKDPEESPLVDKAKLTPSETAGKVALPLCTECYGNGTKPVLVGRSDKVTEELGRKAKKAEAKEAVKEQKVEAKRHKEEEAAAQPKKASKGKAATTKGKAKAAAPGKPAAPGKGSLHSFFSQLSATSAAHTAEAKVCMCVCICMHNNTPIYYAFICTLWPGLNGGVV